MKKSARADDHGVIALAVLLVGPLLVLGAWFVAAGQGHSSLPDKEAEAIFGAVRMADHGQESEIEVQLTWATPPPLAYRGPGGLITSVPMTIDGPVQNGAALLVVDGQTIRAFMGEEPIIDAISPTSPGEQIAAMHSFLGSAGVAEVPEGPEWSPQTSEAVKAFAESNGWALDKGASPVLRAQWVIWIDEGRPFVPLGPLPQPGLPAPASGSAIAVGRPTITEARVGVPPTTVDSTLLVSGAEVVFDQDGLIGSEGRSALSQLVDDSPAVMVGTLVAPGGAPVPVVPPSAVFNDAVGRTCLFVSDQESMEDIRAVHVAVIGGVPGATQVSGDVDPGTAILLNPTQVASRSQCGS